MNWPVTLATIAVVTNTPLPEVWKFTLGQIARYYKAMPALLPLHNPFAGSVGGDAPAPAGTGGSKGGEIDADKNPEQAVAALAMFGAHVIKRKKGGG